MPGATPYVLVEERTVGGKQSKGKRIFRLALSISTMVLCGFLFIHAILSLIASHTYPFTHSLEYGAKWGVDFRQAAANFTIRVFSAYLLVISFLFLCVELKSTVVLTFAAGMISPLGRGIIYLINGLLVFGLVGNWGLVFGFLWMVCGVLHIAVGARSCRTFYEEGTVDNGTTTVTHGLSFHFPPPPTSLKTTHTFLFTHFHFFFQQSRQTTSLRRPRRRLARRTSAAAVARRSVRATPTAPTALRRSNHLFCPKASPAVLSTQ